MEGAAYKKGVAFLYISLYLRAGSLNKMLSKYVGGGLQEGGGFQDRIRYVPIFPFLWTFPFFLKCCAFFDRFLSQFLQFSISCIS